MIALVGHTGFVGSNIYDAAGGQIDAAYNSKNIGEAFGTCPDLLIYAGLRAEKYLAENDPQKDMGLIVQAQENIAKINPRKLVLISTVDVFCKPKGVDENSVVETDSRHAYGCHRYQLEKWVREKYTDAAIVRLPALFGKNIKKNLIYDCINIVPYMLKAEKLEELAEKDRAIRKYYKDQGNGFYKVDLQESDREALKERFLQLGFSAVHFTDSRSVFQFYNLARLWEDIQIVLDAGITLWHPATEPVSAGEIYRYLTGEVFTNKLRGMPAAYDYRTVYAGLFGRNGQYIMDKQEILKEIGWFVKSQNESKKQGDIG